MEMVSFHLDTKAAIRSHYLVPAHIQRRRIERNGGLRAQTHPRACGDMAINPPGSGEARPVNGVVLVDHSQLYRDRLKDGQQ